MCKLLAVDHQFETLYQPRFTAVLFGERAHFNRIVDNERRLYVMMFAFLTENFVDKFSFTHAGIGRDSQLGAYLPESGFVHFTDIEPGVFFDCFVNAYTWIGSGE